MLAFSRADANTDVSDYWVDQPTINSAERYSHLTYPPSDGLRVPVRNSASILELQKTRVKVVGTRLPLSFSVPRIIAEVM